MEKFIDITDKNIDVQEIMKQIRADIRKKKAAGLYPDDLEEKIRLVPTYSVGSDDLGAYLKAMQDNWEINTSREVETERRAIAPLIVLIKKVTRKLSQWYVNDIAEQVMRYQSYNTNAIAKAKEQLDDIDRRLAAVENELKEKAGRKNK